MVTRPYTDDQCNQQVSLAGQKSNANTGIGNTPCICDQCTQANSSAQTAQEPVEDSFDKSCSVCSRAISKQDPVYTCWDCYGYPEMSNEEEDFDICRICKSKGEECPNNDGGDSHKLAAFIIRRNGYQFAPTREIYPLDSPIIRAVKTRNTMMLSSLASNQYLQYLLNTKDTEGNTPLRLAIRSGYKDIITILLDAGADMNILAENEYPAVSQAIRYDYPDILECLLDRDADVNGRTGGQDDAESPLHVAAATKNKVCMSILLKYGPLVDIECEGRTPLIEACSQNDLDCAKLLLDAGADANFAYWKPGASPLIAAIKENNGAMVALLHKRGAMIDAADEKTQFTPLMWSVKENCGDACIALLEAGANLELRAGTTGFTALIQAANDGCFEVAQTLLDKGRANVNTRSTENWTALTRAAYFGHVDVVELLVQHRALPNPVPYNSWTQFQFDPNVTMDARREIIELVRRPAVPQYGVGWEVAPAGY